MYSGLKFTNNELTILAPGDEVVLSEKKDKQRLQLQKKIFFLQIYL